SRICGCDAEIPRAGGVVEEENSLPGSATVGRAEHTALRVRAKRVADSRDVGAIGVARIDDEIADLPRVVETEVLPAVAAVGGAVHTGAIREVFSRLRLARADVDDVGI